MFFNVYIKTGLLACESSEVVRLRVWRILAGGPTAFDESMLMVREKMDAAREAGCHLVAGGSLSSVIDRYRGHVAANVERLTSRSPRDSSHHLRGEIENFRETA